MKKILTIIFVVGLTTVCFGQVQDDFSDGDFTNNPAWSGSTSQFIVNASMQLQLNNTVAGQSYITTPFIANTLDNYEWQAYVTHGFSPSGSNYGRVYLTSNQADLTQPLNGYYLQFGEALSNDAIELFRQSGTSSVSVCRGTGAAIAARSLQRRGAEPDRENESPQVVTATITLDCLLTPLSPETRAPQVAAVISDHAAAHEAVR